MSFKPIQATVAHVNTLLINEFCTILSANLPRKVSDLTDHKFYAGADRQIEFPQLANAKVVLINSL